MSTATHSGTTHRGLLSAGVVVLPLLVLCLYLFVSRAVREFSTWSEIAAFVVAVFSGAICLWKVLPPNGWRPLILVLYVIASAVALAMFSLVFVCAVFGDCL